MRRLFLVALTLGAVALSPAVALADFTPATLVSGNRLIPFERAGSPALSGDGRYVVFQGSLSGVPGVYRRDLQTGEVEPVAGTDAAAPSVSADGRYIAFTTTADLAPAEVPGGPGEPENDRGCPEVYVRNMRPEAGEQEYVLASALDRSAKGIAYLGGCPAPASSSLAIAGTQAAPGVAISADGRYVVFTVLSPSDLTPGVQGSQVAVRDLSAQRTTLVTVVPTATEQPVEGGGAFPSAESEQHGIRSVEAASDQPAGSSAAISADGSTVAWLGTNIPSQVPPATDVVEGMARLGRPVATEVEPLWRRVADGSAAVTKRLLSGAGLSFYFSGSEEIPEAVNGGTLYPGNQVFVPPVLSGDGATVAVIANAPTAANEASYAYVSTQTPTPADAYIVHVGNGSSGSPQVTPLTVTPNFAAANALIGGVRDIAISPDGSRVAFNSARTSFALAPPTLISPPALETATAYSYEANLSLGTLRRVTSTYDGSAPNGQPTLLSFSADGLSLAFASQAGNLFYGDATPGASQVYLVHETPAATLVAVQRTSAIPATALPVPDWILSATASAQADGSVLLDAQVPGAGRLGARATAQLPSSVLGGSRPARRSHGKGATAAAVASQGGRGARRRGHPKQTGHGTGSAVPAHTVAVGGTVAGGPSELQLRLRVSARYRSLTAGRVGLYSVIRVTFTAHGRPALVREIPVTFRAFRRAPKGKRSSKSVAGRSVGIAR